MPLRLLSLLLLLLSWIGLHLLPSHYCLHVFQLFSSVLHVEWDEKASHFNLILLTGIDGQSWPTLSLPRLCCSPYWGKNLDHHAIIKLLVLSFKQNIWNFYFWQFGSHLSFHFLLLRIVICQNLLYTGMKYTTAAFSRAIDNVIPAFAFSMAWILG